MLSPLASLDGLDLPVPAPFPSSRVTTSRPPRSVADDDMSVLEDLDEDDDDEMLATIRAMPVPPAPAPKDMDSFSQGTSVGDFEDMEYVAPGQPVDSYDYTSYEYPAPDVERWRAGVTQVDPFLGRRPLPTPPPESGDRAAKRRRVSELPASRDHRQFIVAPAARQGSLQPDVERQANALKIELKGRHPALVRAASAPPVLRR